MNNKRLELIKLFENIFIFVILYTIIIIPLALVSDNISAVIYKTFALVLIIFTQSLIRSNVKNFFIFLLLHLGLIGICFLFGNGIFEKIIYVFFGFLSAIISYKTHFSPHREAYSIPFLLFSEVLITACYIIAGYFKIVELPGVIYFLSIFLLIIFMFYYHGVNMAAALGNISSIKNQPIKQILSFNTKVIILFLALMLIFLLLAPFLHIGDFINLLGALLLGILRFIFSKLSSSPLPETYVEQSAPVAQDSVLEMIAAETKEPSIILQVIEKIFMYALSIAMIVGIVLLVGFAIYTFYKRFYSAGKKSEVDETKEFIGLIDIINESPLTGFFKRIIPNSFGYTNEQKIRRLFYNKVKKQISKGTEVKTSETATEILSKINQNNNLTDFAPLYEKARYSNIPCTKEDINSANTIISKK